MKLPNYSDVEERMNYLTHGFAALVSIVGFFVLLYYSSFHNDNYFWFGTIVFGISLITAFTASTFYHGVKQAKWKGWFRLIDHLAIYFLIAGSYSPFTLGNLRNEWGWYVFILIWVLAIGGMVFKFIIRHKVDDYTHFDAYFYAGIGCVAIPFLGSIISNVETVGCMLLIAGGALYLTGVFFYLNEKIPYNHAIWHLFVMAAAGMHYFAVLWYATPPIG
jgi:hemolysin III